MAQLVFAAGSSHGPTIQSTPDKWLKLAERDKRDPRYDFQAYLREARPGLDREITPEVLQERYKVIHADLDKLTEVIASVPVDVMIVVSNIHRVRDDDNHPVFGIVRADSFETARMSQRLFDPNAKHFEDMGRTPEEIVAVRPGHPALANHLIETLIDDNFDVASTDVIPKGVPLDDAFAFPDEWMLKRNNIPMVPLQVSRDLPNQATSSRCYDLGTALRRAVEKWPVDARVGVIASGGLSHQVVDEELDKLVVDALLSGDVATLRALPRKRLNRGPGTPEILNWVIAAAAMAPTKMTLVGYTPCYRSLAGTGHGICFGYWKH
jgi:3-O-methylgallate 3,4-dioxygenase